MTKQQRHHQPDERITLPGGDSDGASTEGLSTEGLSAGGFSTGGFGTDDLDVERVELDRAWAEFSRARASLAEVMSDDELRAFGFNVEALDERP